MKECTMKLFRSFLLMAICGVSYSTSIGLPQLEAGFENIASSKLKSRYFEQKLDHFNVNDKNTWKQAYYLEDRHYKNGGPVYLWINGPEKNALSRIVQGYWVSHAENKNAMLLSVVHRFHDVSCEDSSDNILAYLSVPQALADIEAFIKGMNKKHNFSNSTKWIVFGASYAGNLAAWMRAKYPNLIHGAVASSAPILAKMEFPEYLMNIEKSISSYNKNCRDDIAKANQKLDELVETNKGRKEINNTFKLCDPLDDSKLRTSYLMKNMVNYITQKMEYDLENKNVKRICDKMLEDVEEKTPVQRYAALMEMLFTDNYQKCIKTDFKEYTDNLKGTDMISNLITGRSWLYQICTEFGWFQTSRKKSTAFSKKLNLNYYAEICAEVFDYNKDRIAHAVTKTNKVSGGLSYNTPRTLFVHGSNDPWRNLGITSTKKNKNVEVIIIKGGTHSTEAYYAHVNSENKERKAAIQKIIKTLDTWLKK